MSIYFDNAATTPMDEVVIEAMLPFMREQFGNPSAIHHVGRKVRKAVEDSRKVLAKLLNASPAEICFTSGGTEANNTALLGAVRDLSVKRIISSPIEHPCILTYLDFLKATYGVEICLLSVNEKGCIEYDQLALLLAETDAKTLVSLMHGNNEIGTMTDMARISSLCKENGALYHSDTVQTFGHFPIDVQETPIDFMVCSAHKLHGPKGIGFLYCRSEHAIRPLLLGGSQERNRRAGTENTLGIIGLAAAATNAYAHIEKERIQIKGLRDYLLEQLLLQFDDIQVNGNIEEDSLYHVLNVSFPKGQKNEYLLFNLDIEGICASGGSACSSGANQGSHVLRSIGVDPDRASIRFSFSKMNKKEEVDQLLTVLKKITD